MQCIETYVALVEFGCYPAGMSKNASSMPWERPEPRPRPAPVPLSRDAIVRTAIVLADAEGLSAVTLRNVATALGAGPMRLYGYIATKEDLLALMIDAVYAEMLAEKETPAGEWRLQIATLACALRGAAFRHPWFIALLGGRPHQGPNALAFTEAMLAAVADAPGLDGIDAIFQAAKVIGAYVLGAVRDETAEAVAVLESEMTKAEWQAENWPYMQRMIATGRFPMLARVISEMDHPTPEAVFYEGLGCVLDGIARRSPN